MCNPHCSHVLLKVMTLEWWPIIRRNLGGDPMSGKNIIKFWNYFFADIVGRISISGNLE